MPHISSGILKMKMICYTLLSKEPVKSNLICLAFVAVDVIRKHKGVPGHKEFSRYTINSNSNF